MIVGREPELAAIAEMLEVARQGRRSVLCFEGEPGIGKTTLLYAAEELADDFLTLQSTGIESELDLGNATLLDILGPLRQRRAEIPAGQRLALESALGWSLAAPPGTPYLVAAGTLSLLAVAAENQPLLVILDDLQWIDRESRVALMFAAHRLQHDRVAFLFARRDVHAQASELVDIPRLRIGGLAPADAAAVLGGRVGERVAQQLVAETRGNPLALIETARALTPEQRRGSSPLPDVLPVGDRISAGFVAALTPLSADTRTLLLLVAASADGNSAPVFAALRAEGVDPDDALAEAERHALLALVDGELAFPHPLLRAAVWRAAKPVARRGAHAAMARVTASQPHRRARHLAQAVVGPDDELAADLEGLAALERVRHGHAAASALHERAARLYASPEASARARAAAAEEALLAGDVQRVRAIGADALSGATDPAVRARVLLTLGVLEQYSGSVPKSKQLLTEAATLGTAEVRTRAYAELATVAYRLGSRDTMAAAAADVRAFADDSDPEQQLLALYTEGAALAYADRWSEAHDLMLRAIELLEGDPTLRDEPRHLPTALLAAGWAGEPFRALEYADRRLEAARTSGALGVLPLTLSILAGGWMLLNDHERAYAFAGEAVEIGTELGYAVDLALAYELLAWEQAARGLHDAAEASLARSWQLDEVAEVADVAVHFYLVEAFAALCRGDLEAVVRILEERIAADGGRMARGEYPFGVAPDLVEAYLALGRRDEAAALVARHAELHQKSEIPDVRAHAARLAGLVAVDEDEADAAFVEAHLAHAEGFDRYEAARTRLAHGSRLRRAGQRIAARELLRAAADDFTTMGLDLWADRANRELAATGLTAQRGPGGGSQLTSQETRVALLVAQGLSNREIATALFLSHKTVEHHVSSILRKRELRSRTEVAAAFAREG